MQQELKKKISVYSGIAGALLLSESMNAQVIYTDINPDKAFNAVLDFNHPYNIDMNIDGVPDFTFANWFMFSYTSTSQGSTSYGYSTTNQNFIFCSALGLKPAVGGAHPPNNILATPSPWSSSSNTNSLFVQGLAQNQLITPLLSRWNDRGTLVATFGTGSSIRLPLNQDAYVGVRFNINSADWYYGWIRIYPIDSKTFIIRDFAYEATPNTSIVSRTLATGIAESSNLSLTLKQEENNFTLNFTDPYQKNISVRNLLGQEIMTTSTSESSFNFSIDNKGIFIVEVTSNGKRYTKKVFAY